MMAMRVIRVEKRNPSNIEIISYSDEIVEPNMRKWDYYLATPIGGLPAFSYLANQEEAMESTKIEPIEIIVSDKFPTLDKQM